MEWYVLNYDFNKRKAYNFNIFNNVRFLEELKRIYIDLNCSFDSDIDVFKDRLMRSLRYCFWCKTEYEIYVRDAFHDEDNEISKIDVYSQVLPNLDILADYIIKNEQELIKLILLEKI